MNGTSSRSRRRLRLPRPSIASVRLHNNDVVLVSFAVEGGPEQEALGRVAQMLAALVSRGRAGLTSAEFAPGVRVSDSIHKLRHRHGLGIETERVGHGGIYSGEHAIYRLSSPVRVVELVRAAEMRARKTSGEVHLTRGGSSCSGLTFASSMGGFRFNLTRNPRPPLHGRALSQMSSRSRRG